MAAMNSSAEYTSKFFRVFTFFDPALVNHLLGFLNEPDFLDIENIPYDVLGNGFPALCIFPLDTNAVVDAKTGMAPGHQFPDQLSCDLSLLLQEFKNIRTKQVFKRFEVCLPHHIKCPGVSEKSVSDVAFLEKRIRINCHLFFEIVGSIISLSFFPVSCYWQ